MTENIKNPWGFNDLMVIAAFRYCLGRSTYIVGTCVDWLTEHWPNFSVDTQQLIKKKSLKKHSKATMRIEKKQET